VNCQIPAESVSNDAGKERNRGDRDRGHDREGEKDRDKRYCLHIPQGGISSHIVNISPLTSIYLFTVPILTPLFKPYFNPYRCF